MDKFQSWFKRIAGSYVMQTFLGFLAFLFFAAWAMYFFESPVQNTFDSFFHALWYAIVTVTTVGYGDMSPKTELGQIAAVFIMFVGIAYAGVFTGLITTWLVEKNRRKQLGLSPLKKLEKKFLVCGWKTDMA